MTNESRENLQYLMEIHDFTDAPTAWYSLMVFVAFGGLKVFLIKYN